MRRMAFEFRIPLLIFLKSSGTCDDLDTGSSQLVSIRSETFIVSLPAQTVAIVRSQQTFAECLRLARTHSIALKRFVLVRCTSRLFLFSSLLSLHIQHLFCKKTWSDRFQRYFSLQFAASLPTFALCPPGLSMISVSFDRRGGSSSRYCDP